jgi:HSP20 family protein
MNLMKRIRLGKEGGALSEPDRGSSMFRRELDRAFDRARRAFARGPLAGLEEVDSSWPAIDVSEDDKSFSVRVDVPGLGPKDVDVEVSGNLLTVQGSRKEEHEQKDAGVYRHERFVGSFARSITLPASADPQKVEARYDKGVLTITAPKLPGTQPKKVAVKA